MTIVTLHIELNIVYIVNRAHFLEPKNTSNLKNYTRKTIILIYNNILR